MALGLATSIRNTMVQAIELAIDTSSTGTLKLYNSPQPATGAAITSQTLLATFSLPNPCAPSASGGVLTFNAISSVTAAASGTAIWGRFANNAGTFVGDCTVGTSGTDIVLGTNVLTSGLTVQITSATITAGNS